MTRTIAMAEALDGRSLLAAAAVPTPDHVVVVMMENKGYADVIGNPSAAYINQLAAGGALFTQSFAVTHPSQPNYIALFSGSTQGVTSDDGPNTFSGPDLGAQLIGAGKTFTGYSEDLPAAGSTVLTYGEYARKHNPWSDFTDVPAVSNQPFTAFPTDYTKLPTVSFVIPNLDHDMHDGTIADGDAWVQTKLGAYAAWAKTHNSLLVVTFDEDDGNSPANQIATVFYGQPVAAGQYAESVNHYSVLRTIEAMYGLNGINNAADAQPITDVWQGSGTTPPNPTPADTYVSNLTPTSATTGYGTIHNDASINGNPITLRGTTYAKGIGTHAASTITYALNGGYTTFASDVGVDDEVLAKGGVGSIDFKVVGDGKTLYDSGALTAKSAVPHISVSVAGVKTLQLVATNTIAGNIDYDHADWAGARLTAAASPAPTVPSVPTNLAAAGTASDTISLSWVDTATNALNCVVDRSADGGATFTPIATLAAGAVSYDDKGLAAGTKYTYRVRATNAVGSSPASNTASASTLAAGSSQAYVSDLAWTSATTGYSSVHKDASVNGNPIKLRGTTYAKGLGTHAASTITYNLAGAYSTFFSDVGIDDETTGQGLVDFKVIGDGKTLYDSGNLSDSAAVAHVSVSVAGVKTLQLVAANGVSGSIDFDHADWAGARLTAAAVAPAAPSKLTAAAAAGEIDLAWASNSVNQAGFRIERSTDGVTFAALGTTTAAAYADKTAAAGTKYTYRVSAYNAAGMSAPSNTASATAFATAPVTTYASDLAWASATSGYLTVQKDKSIKGNTISLHGTKYTKGLGTHAASTITYNLAGKYASFLADVGIDDEVTESGSVDFKVIGDGVTLFDTGVLTSASPTVSINVSVANVKTLQLVATNGIAGSIDYDHADWANARLLST